MGECSGPFEAFSGSCGKAGFAARVRGGPGNSPSLGKAKPVANYEVPQGTGGSESSDTSESNRLPSWCLSTPLLLVSSQLLTCLRPHVLAPQEGTELVVVIMGAGETVEDSLCLGH